MFRQYFYKEFVVVERVSFFLAAHLFPLVSFHTDSGEIIILPVKCFNMLRIHLGPYHRRHHLKDLGGEIVISMMMYSTFSKSLVAS